MVFVFLCPVTLPITSLKGGGTEPTLGLENWLARGAVQQVMKLKVGRLNGHLIAMGRRQYAYGGGD